MRLYSSDQKTAVAARMLTQWKASKRKLISLDADTFMRLFPYLEPVHTVHDQNQNVKFLLVDREKAITLIENDRNLKDGSPIR